MVDFHSLFPSSCSLLDVLALSFAFAKRIDQSAGRISEFTVKPWFCVVIKQWWEMECMHGWF